MEKFKKLLSHAVINRKRKRKRNGGIATKTVTETERQTKARRPIRTRHLNFFVVVAFQTKNRESVKRKT